MREELYIMLASSLANKLPVTTHNDLEYIAVKALHLTRVCMDVYDSPAPLTEPGSANNNASLSNWTV